jgi:DNA-binding NtrC family response regulator
MKAEPAAKRRPHVLVVTADPTTRRSTWASLEEAGFQVETSADALAALSIVESRAALDAVVIDGDHRHMSGAQLAQRIYHLRPGMPIIACTDRPAILPRSTTATRLSTSSLPAHLAETLQRALSKRRR